MQENKFAKQMSEQIAFYFIYFLLSLLKPHERRFFSAFIASGFYYHHPMTHKNAERP